MGNVCLSVILEFCLLLSSSLLSVVVCSAPTDYASLCRGLKYLLKIFYFIHYYLNMVEFLIFDTVFWALGLHCFMSEKYHNNELHLCLVSSPNFHRMYILSINSFEYINMVDVRLYVMEHPLILLRFWVFSNRIDEKRAFMSEILDLPKLSQIVCLINIHILICQHAKCACSL